MSGAGGYDISASVAVDQVPTISGPFSVTDNSTGSLTSAISKANGTSPVSTAGAMAPASAIDWPKLLLYAGAAGAAILFGVIIWRRARK